MNKTELEEKLRQNQQEANQLRNEIRNFEYKELKEKYGEQLKCCNCRYVVITDVGDRHSSCVKNNCYLCHSSQGCKDFKLKNKISEFICLNNLECSYENKIEILEKENILDLDDELFPIVEIILENLLKLEKEFERLEYNWDEDEI